MTSDRRRLQRSLPRSSGVGSRRLGSVIITNHNYEPFLQQAVDSALVQSYPDTEVIVVDDGSTDSSREILSRYGDRIRTVFKANGGQTSAINAGYAEARGDFVCFLDSDDVLLPEAMQAASRLLGPGVSKVHWRLTEIDRGRSKTGGVIPHNALAEGDLLSQLLDAGPDACTFPPQSGNVFSRRFLDKVFPLPELEQTCGVASASADAYLSLTAILHGEIRLVPEPLTLYRVHGRNDYWGTDLRSRIDRHVCVAEHHFRWLEQELSRNGHDVDIERWRERSWFFRLQRLVAVLEAATPSDETIAIVGEHELGIAPAVHRNVQPFPEANGYFAGYPLNDDDALESLDRLQRSGVALLAVVWPAFWWLEVYPALGRRLESFREVVSTSDVRLVSLSQPVRNDIVS